MGFRLSEDQEEGDAGDDTDLLNHLRSEDLIEYGFESEFIGRLPIVAVLDELSRADLLQILRSPRCSVILSKKRDFRAYGIGIEFSDEALQLLAGMAQEEHTGARGLVSALERVLLNYERRLPSAEVRDFTVTADVVRDPAKHLQPLLAEHSLQSYAEHFAEEHGIRLAFDPSARALVKDMARAGDQSPQELCAEIFSDYGHGLKLLELTEFSITEEIVRQPQECLNELIKELYNQQR